MSNRSRKIETAKVDKSNKEKKVLVVSTILRPIEKERKKVMSKNMIKKNKKGIKIRRIWT